MPEIDWLCRQMELERELHRLAGERREGRRLVAEHRAESERVAREDFQERARLNLESSRARRQLARRNDERRERVLLAAVDARRASVAGRGRGVSVHSEVVLPVSEDVREKADDDLREALWSAAALYEGWEAAAHSSHSINTTRLDEARELIAQIRGARDWKLSSYPTVRRLVKAATPEPARLRGGDLNERIAEARRLLDQLASHEPSARSFLPTMLVSVVFMATFYYPAQRTFGALRGPAFVAVGAILLGIVLALRARGKAARPMATDVLELDRTLVEAEAALEHKAARLQRRLQLRRKRNTQKRELQEQQARKAHARALRPHVDPQDRYEAIRVRQRLAVLETCRSNVAFWTREHLSRRLTALHEQHHRELTRAREDYRSILDVVAECARTDAIAVDRAWYEGWSKVCAGVATIERECSTSAWPWDSPDWVDWTPQATAPPLVRIGEIELNLDLGPELPRPVASLPLALPTAEPRNLALVASTESDRLAVIAALNAVMMRFVTSLPPGSLQLTILDPVGLGAGFAEFLHLADHADSLVSYRIWTESEPISACLSDQIEPLESTGDECGVLRLLVIADFPVGFDPNALERLAQLLEEGPRSRVGTLLGVDRRKDLDMGFVEALSLVLTCRDGRFHGGEHLFADSPLAIDSPPDRDVATRLLTLVGRSAAELEVSPAQLRVLT
jgi:S-DNA-T family DNA segregation ATPase FtsK/SpoIIIE